MTSAPRPLEYFYSPTMFLAYGWAYAFTVSATGIGLNATRVWPAWATWPVIVLGFGAIFAIVVGLRPVLLDLSTDLGLREKFGIFLLHGLFFIAPKSIWPRATLLDCLIALQLPLAAFLLRRESFIRLYTVNFLIVALAVFVVWQTRGGGFAWAACLPVLLAGCFAADRFFFEIDRYPNVSARPIGRPLLVTIRYAATSLAGGGLLFAATPNFALIGPQTAAQPVEQRGGVQTISGEALLRLVWDTFFLLVLLIVTLAILQWLKRRYERKGAQEEVSTSRGVMRMVKKAIRPKPRPPQMPRGFSPREQIVRGYWSWCDEMERFGLSRAPEVTPKEYARSLGGRAPKVVSPVAELTRLFESAKYDRGEPARPDAEAFFAHSRRVIEILLASAHAR